MGPEQPPVAHKGSYRQTRPGEAQALEDRQSRCSSSCCRLYTSGTAQAAFEQIRPDVAQAAACQTSPGTVQTAVEQTHRHVQVQQRLM
jgi:hypothetical protein